MFKRKYVEMEQTFSGIALVTAGKAEPGPDNGEQDATDQEAAVILENDLYERTSRK